MITFVAGNPAADRVYEVEVVRPGAIHRPHASRALPGGKGINAARAAHLLGADSHVLSILGGHTGRWIEDRLREEGIGGTFAWADVETRTCVSIASSGTETGSGADPGFLTGFYERSEPIGADKWAELEAALRPLLARSELLCLSGSVISGAPLDGYRRLAEQANRAGVPVAIDSHGPELREALHAGPALIKVNAEEAAEALEERCPDQDLLKWAAHAAARLQHSVPRNRLSVVTCGTSGMALASARVLLVGRLDQVGSFPVGSGDAVLGCMAIEMCAGAAEAELLALGLGAGAANAEVPGPGLLDPSRVQALADQSLIEAIRVS